MGFPNDYKFSDGSKAYAEIGRGLCTHNARFLGRVIMDGLQRDVPVEATPRLNVVDWRKRVKKMSIKMPPKERGEWFAGRHPDLNVPEEWL